MEIEMPMVAEVTSDKKVSRSTSPWGMLFLVTAVYVVSYMNRQMFGLMMPAVSREFHLTDTEIGQLTGLSFPIFFGIASLAVSVAADRLNRATLITISTIAFSIMAMLCGVTLGFWTMFLARVLLGVSEAGPLPPSVSLIADNFHGPGRQIANVVFCTTGPLSMLGAFVICGNINVWFGWRVAFLSAGLMSAAVGLLCLLYLRDESRKSIASLTFRELRNFPVLLRIPTLRWAILGSTFYTASAAASTQWLPLFFSRSLHMNDSQTSWFLGITFAVIGLVSLAISGMMGAWLRRKSVGASVSILSGVVLLLTAATLLVMFLSFNQTVCLSALIVFIFFYFVPFGPLMALAQDATPSADQAKASGLLFFLCVVGFGGGSLLIGLLSDAFAPYAGVESLRFAILVVAATTALLGAGCSFLGARSSQRDAAAASAHEPLQAL